VHQFITVISWLHSRALRLPFPAHHRLWSADCLLLVMQASKEPIVAIGVEVTSACLTVHAMKVLIPPADRALKIAKLSKEGKTPRELAETFKVSFLIDLPATNQTTGLVL